jgi:putative flippase GtrA
MQSIQIFKKNVIRAGLCATGVAVTNVVMLKLVPGASAYTLIAYILANAVGVPLAMYIGNQRASKGDDLLKQ